MERSFCQIGDDLDTLNDLNGNSLLPVVFFSKLIVSSISFARYVIASGISNCAGGANCIRMHVLVVLPW